MARCSSTLVCAACLLGPFVLLFLALSFSTNYWVSYTVIRSSLTSSQRKTSQSDAKLRFYHSRNRGLFRECFQGNETLFLDKDSTVVDTNCYSVEYDVKQEMLSQPFSDQYWARIHLLRCHLAFMTIGLVAYLLAFVTGMVICCKRRPAFAKAAGLFGFCSAFSIAAAIAFFHGAEYIERNTITVATDGKMFYQSWPSELKSASHRKYDWSYILAWVGMILGAICSVCYIIAAWMLKNERKMEDSDEILKHRYSGGPVLVHDGPYMDDPYYNKMHHHSGPRQAAYPYVVEMQNRQPVPVGYGEPHWQWQ